MVEEKSKSTAGSIIRLGALTGIGYLGYRFLTIPKSGITVPPLVPTPPLTLPPAVPVTIPPTVPGIPPTAEQQVVDAFVDIRAPPAPAQKQQVRGATTLEDAPMLELVPAPFTEEREMFTEEEQPEEMESDVPTVVAAETADIRQFSLPLPEDEFTKKKPIVNILPDNALSQYFEPKSIAIRGATDFFNGVTKSKSKSMLTIGYEINYPKDIDGANPDHVSVMPQVKLWYEGKSYDLSASQIKLPLKKGEVHSMDVPIDLLTAYDQMVSDFVNSGNREFVVDLRIPGTKDRFVARKKFKINIIKGKSSGKLNISALRQTCKKYDKNIVSTLQTGDSIGKSPFVLSPGGVLEADLIITNTGKTKRVFSIGKQLNVGKLEFHFNATKTNVVLSPGETKTITVKDVLPETIYQFSGYENKILEGILYYSIWSGWNKDISYKAYVNGKEQNLAGFPTQFILSVPLKVEIAPPAVRFNFFNSNMVQLMNKERDSLFAVYSEFKNRPEYAVKEELIGAVRNINKKLLGFEDEYRKAQRTFSPGVRRLYQKYFQDMRKMITESEQIQGKTIGVEGIRKEERYIEQRRKLEVQIKVQIQEPYNKLFAEAAAAGPGLVPLEVSERLWAENDRLGKILVDEINKGSMSNELASALLDTRKKIAAIHDSQHKTRAKYFEDLSKKNASASHLLANAYVVLSKADLIESDLNTLDDDVFMYLNKLGGHGRPDSVISMGEKLLNRLNKSNDKLQNQFHLKISLDADLTRNETTFKDLIISDRRFKPLKTAQLKSAFTGKQLGMSEGKIQVVDTRVINLLRDTNILVRSGANFSPSNAVWTNYVPGTKNLLSKALRKLLALQEKHNVLRALTRAAYFNYRLSGELPRNITQQPIDMNRLGDIADRAEIQLRSRHDYNKVLPTILKQINDMRKEMGLGSYEGKIFNLDQANGVRQATEKQLLDYRVKGPQRIAEEQGKKQKEGQRSQISREIYTFVKDIRANRPALIDSSGVLKAWMIFGARASPLINLSDEYLIKLWHYFKELFFLIKRGDDTKPGLTRLPVGISLPIEGSSVRFTQGLQTPVGKYFKPLTKPVAK